MEKPLSEMTLEELWELFPILLSEPKDCWKAWYLEEEGRLKEILPQAGLRLNHVGSTAISGIWAKPIVDIMLEIPRETSMERIKDILTQKGYTCMWQQEDRMSFNLGYTSRGFAERVFHLHLRYWGDNDELYFRDYLNEKPQLAKEYEALKLKLWKRFEHDRDAYTAAKGDFIKECTARAKEKYGNFYD